MSCSHPVVLANLCAVCGRELPSTSALYHVLHSTDRLMVDKHTIDQHCMAQRDRLRSSRRLVLVIDLDQTIVHTVPWHGRTCMYGDVKEDVNDGQTVLAVKDNGRQGKQTDGQAMHGSDGQGKQTDTHSVKDSDGQGRQTDGQANTQSVKDNGRQTNTQSAQTINCTAQPAQDRQWHVHNNDSEEGVVCITGNATLTTFIFRLNNHYFLTTVRPHLRQMLTALSRHYEMHVYTLGTAAYVRVLLSVIDKDGHFFMDRIVSREITGRKRLDRLFGESADMVVVLDDRADVWMYGGNVVLVRPFCGGEDADLLMVVRLLIGIHRTYYADGTPLDVLIPSLNRRILRGARVRVCRALPDYENVREVVRMHGGRVDTSEYDVLIDDAEKVRWLWECVWRREWVDEWDGMDEWVDEVERCIG